MGGIPRHIYIETALLAFGLAGGAAVQLIGSSSDSSGILLNIFVVLTVVGLIGLFLGVWSWIKGLQKELGRAREVVLQQYFDRMEQWLDDEDRPLDTYDNNRLAEEFTNIKVTNTEEFAGYPRLGHQLKTPLSPTFGQQSAGR